MLSVCTGCGDSYDPVEYRPAPIDPDEPRFCSDGCEDSWADTEEFDQVYNEAGTGAPVY